MTKPKKEHLEVIEVKMNKIFVKFKGFNAKTQKYQEKSRQNDIISFGLIIAVFIAVVISAI